MAEGSICRKCFHSYVCEQFNEHKDSDNKKCRFFNDHFVPTANVVEVVRCKDCKHYYENYYANGEVFERVCRLRSTGCGYGEVHFKTDNGYCSFGERRADNDR